MVDEADGTEQKVAVGLMMRSGLRTAEVVDIIPATGSE